MRAGTLDKPTTLLELSTDLQRVEIDWMYCGIQTKESAEPPFPAGLRSPAKIAIRAWYDKRLRQGRYLEADGRLFHIDSARDFSGVKAELAITATELIGDCAEYRPAEGVPRSCRVFLTPSAPFKDDLGQVIDYRLHAEVALIETGRVQVDDQLLVAGQLYNVLGVAGGSDDGVVRGLWLEVVE